MATVIEGQFATQSGHWYRKDGTPAYTVVGKNGKERAANIRDARELGLVPSVTTIMRQVSAPGLEFWKLGNAVRAALKAERIEGEEDDAFVSRIIYSSQDETRAAADRGTEIHAALEDFYKGNADRVGGYLQHCVNAAKAIMDWCGPQEWSAERSFASPLGYGGKVDLCETKFGHVIDFKTKQGDVSAAKLYPEHRAQLAAYRSGLGVRNAKCAIVFVSTDGPAVLREVEERELQRGYDEFTSLLEFWKARNLK